MFRFVSAPKCITEAERYAAKGTFVAKPEKNKAAQKQELWTECIQELAQRPQFDGKTRSMLNRIAAQTNVPRKKPKFVNFVKNCMKYSANDAERVWQVIEVGLEEFAKKSASVAPPVTTKQADVAAEKVLPLDPPTNGAAEPAARAESNAVNGKSADTGSLITITSIVKHAVKQADTTKPVKKALKKLLGKSDVPLNVDAPKKKKLTKYLQEQLQLGEDDAQKACSVVLETLNALRSQSAGNPSGELANGTNGVTGNKRKNDCSESSEQEQSTAKKAKTIDATEDTANGDATIDWQKCILKMFNKNQQDNRLGLDALKAKVMKKLTKGANDAQSIAYAKKFKKQLKKVDSLQVIGNVVQVKAQ